MILYLIVAILQNVAELKDNAMKIGISGDTSNKTKRQARGYTKKQYEDTMNVAEKSEEEIETFVWKSYLNHKQRSSVRYMRKKMRKRWYRHRKVIKRGYMNRWTQINELLMEIIKTD